MSSATLADGGLFRVWIGNYHNWQPAHWDDVPNAFEALEPAESGHFSAAEAAAYLEGFNSRMLVESRPVWAVAVPVAVHYEGDLAPGACITLPGAHARAACACR